VAAALPQGQVRYRAELDGVPVGVAELRVSCKGDRCALHHGTRLRLPTEAGGGVERIEVELQVDAAGRYRGGPIRTARNGARRTVVGIPGAAPSALVELLLAEQGEGCVPFFDEEKPAPRSACARREAGELLADVGEVRARIAPGPDGFPLEVEVMGRFRFVRDVVAQVPSRPPGLAGTRVAGPPDPGRARTFCGVGRDPPAPAPTAALPAPRAEGASCREKTRAWLTAARRRGLDGREAVGIAWDGVAFAWHEWAEVRVSGAWIPVDPTFGELPATSARFTVARFRPDDAKGREAAGARILACWGTAHVE
jgi:hypothetical protein